MSEYLKDLYERYCTPDPMAETEHQVDEIHQQLIERLAKPERKLVLEIIDREDEMAAARAERCFIQGFRLAWGIAAELSQKEEIIYAEGGDDHGKAQAVRGRDGTETP